MKNKQKTETRFISINELIILSILVASFVALRLFFNGTTPRYICSASDPSYCFRYCETDEDCVFTCGCGAINRNEHCFDAGIIYDCEAREVKCSDSYCVLA